MHQHKMVRSEHVILEEMKRVAEVLPALTRLVCAGDKGAHERCCVNFASVLLTMSTDVHNN